LEEIEFDRDRLKQELENAESDRNRIEFDRDRLEQENRRLRDLCRKLPELRSLR
jgi:hypothetical protein